jgi:hypothetical protein
MQLPTCLLVLSQQHAGNPLVYLKIELAFHHGISFGFENHYLTLNFNKLLRILEFIYSKVYPLEFLFKQSCRLIDPKIFYI